MQAKRADPGEAAALKVNQDMLARYLTLANQLAEEGATPPSADGLLSLRGVLEAPEEVDDPEARSPLVEAAMALTIEQALDALKAVAPTVRASQLLPVLTDFIDRIAALTAAGRNRSGRPDRRHPRAFRAPHDRTGPRRAGSGGADLP